MDVDIFYKFLPLPAALLSLPLTPILIIFSVFCKGAAVLTSPKEVPETVRT